MRKDGAVDRPRGDLQQDEQGSCTRRSELEQVDARLAQVVQMRYFGGYSEREIAETLDVTERTVQRDWEKAKMLLRVILSPD
jgi:RNA polymerase sigma factor (sigma-70 family)